MKDTILGLVTAGGLGALVRLANLPIPAPPTVTGGLMVCAVTVGYILAGVLLARIKGQ